MNNVESLLETLIAEIQGLREDIKDLKGSGDVDLSDISASINENGGSLSEIKFELESGLGFGPLGIAQQIRGSGLATLADLHDALIDVAVAIQTK